jgi:hypothetical protein
VTRVAPAALAVRAPGVFLGSLFRLRSFLRRQDNRSDLHLWLRLNGRKSRGSRPSPGWLKRTALLCFIRRLKDGERPVASPDDTKVIVSACESAPYGIS